jgi:hypothetical protein
LLGRSARKKDEEEYSSELRRIRQTCDTENDSSTSRRMYPLED